MTYEVETDTKIAAAFNALMKAKQQLQYTEYSVRKAAGQKYTRGHNWNNWSGTAHEAVTTIEAHLATGGGYMRGYNAQRTMKDYYEALGTVAVARQDYETLSALYTGWSRFFLVTNNNGHIHSSMNCSTCFATTQFGWLPQLSGLTEAEAVADQGEILCSICFPTAPIAWTTGVSKASQEAAEARKAKSAALAAKKAEKALGTVLRVGRWNDRIETIAAAKTWLTDAAEWGVGHPNYTIEDRNLVAEALAARLNTDADTQWNHAVVRAGKRNR